MRRPNFKCGECSLEIYRRPKQIKDQIRVFCSLKCKSVFSEKTNIHLCPVCKKDFKRKQKAICCSRKCANERRFGIKYEKTKRNLPNSSLRRLALLRRIFNFTHCMIDGCAYGTCYDIHRFIEGKNGGKNGGKYEVGNMFAICPNHHAEITRKIIIVEKINDQLLRIKDCPIAYSPMVEVKYEHEH